MSIHPRKWIMIGPNQLWQSKWLCLLLHAHFPWHACHQGWLYSPVLYNMWQGNSNNFYTLVQVNSCCSCPYSSSFPCWQAGMTFGWDSHNMVMRFTNMKTKRQQIEVIKQKGEKCLALWRHDWATEHTNELSSSR